MSFRSAVGAVDDSLAAAYRPGKQALQRRHANQIDCADANRLTGSIDLDDSLKDVIEHRNASRWDYGLGYRLPNRIEIAIWVEVHPASTSNVVEVLKKFEWLKTWLRESAPDLKALTEKNTSIQAYHWLATNAGVHIRPGTPQERRLRSVGLNLPKRRLTLR